MIASPTSTTELLELIRKSKILQPDVLENRLQEVTNLPSDALQGGAVLVKHGVLTRFQCKLLLAGRWRGFRLASYVLQEQVGQGGMGAVYLAEHETLRRRVALKVLTPPKGDPNVKLSIERFLREARAAAALDHPNIVRLHDVGQQADVHYLVMEFVEGQTLEDLLVKGGPVTPSRAVDYIAQAAAGLQHAFEKGFVHRDIKPANLMLGKDGVVKLLDMGLAKSQTTARDRLTEVMDEGSIVGTADFISPEQAMNQPNIDIRSDIYSLGATFFALVTGRPPFSGNTTQKLIQHQMKEAPSLTELDKTFPQELALVVAKMLAKNPDHRYRTPAEVVTALAPWLLTGGANRVVAGLSGTDMGQTAEMQATMNEMVAGGTKRISKSRLNAAKNRSKGMTIAVAAAVLAAVGAVGYTQFGLSNPRKPDVQGPATGPTASTRTTPEPVNSSQALWAFDAATANSFKQQTQDALRLEGQTLGMPPEIVLHSYGKGGIGSFEKVTSDGVSAIRIENVAGNTAQLCVELEMHKAVFKSGQNYTAVITYRARSGADLAIHEFQENNATRYIEGVPLPATTGRWETVRLPIHRGSNRMRLSVDNRALGGDQVVDVAKIEIVAANAPSAPVSAPTAPVSASADKALYRLDVSSSKPFSERLVGPVHLSESERKLAGWVGINWGEPSVMGEFFADPQENCLGIRTTAGRHQSFLLSPNLRLAPGQSHVYQFDYWFDTEYDYSELLLKIKLPGVAAKDLYRWKDLARGRWATVTGTFDAPADGLAALEVHASQHEATGPTRLKIRNFEVRAAGGGSAVGPPLVAFDFSKMSPFQGTIKNYNWVNDPAVNWPVGVSVGPWDRETESDCRVETVAGKTGLGIVTLSGPNTSQIHFTALKTLPAGTYRVTVVYLTQGSGEAGLGVRKPVQNYESVAGERLEPTNGQWKTATLDFVRPVDTEVDAQVFNHATGAGNQVFVHSLTVASVSTEAAPPPPGDSKPVYRLSADDFLPFRNKKGNAVGGHQGDPEKFPRGVYFFPYKPETLGEFWLEAVDGRNAFAWTNLEGPISGQIGMELQGENSLDLPLVAGRKYQARVEYKAPKGVGRSYVQDRNRYQVLSGGQVDLGASEGWKVVTFTWTQPKEPIRLLVDNTAIGANKVLYVREVTIVDLTGDNKVSTSLPAAPSITPPTTSWRSVWKAACDAVPPFVTRLAEGRFDLNPAETFVDLPITINHWGTATVAEFRSQSVAGKTALGLTVLNNVNEAQFRIENLNKHVQSGQRYQAVVQYLTRNDAAGVCRVRLPNDGYKELGSAVLPNSADGWKTATLEFVAPAADVNVDLTVSNDTIGEGNTLYVHSIELLGAGSAEPTGSGTPAGVRTAQTPVVTVDFSNIKPFKCRFENGKPSSPETRSTFNKGYYFDCWKKESISDFNVETVAGKQGVGITNLTSTISSQFNLWRIDDLNPGKPYVVKVEYLNSQSAVGRCQVRRRKDNYAPHTEVALPGGQPGWQTATVQFVCPPLTSEPDIQITYSGVGEGNTLIIHKVEIYEVLSAAAATSAANLSSRSSVVSLDWSQLPEFQYGYKNGQASDNTWSDIKLTGWALCYKPTSEAVFSRYTADGKSGFAMANTGGPVTTQLHLNESSWTSLQSGQKYTVRIEYATRNAGEGSLNFRVPGDNYAAFLNHKLPSTQGRWNTVDVPLKWPTHGKACDASLDVKQGGAENAFVIRKLDVIPAD